MTSAERRHRFVRASITLVVLGALAGCSSASRAAGPAPSNPAPASAPAGTPLPVPSDDPDATAGTPPTRVRIPAISVESTLEALHLDASGALIPPSFAHAGWYADGTIPGDKGPAVIAGHIDSRSGPAIFYRLGELKAGDVVEVERAGRWLDFRVVDVRRYPKNAFPTNEVYGPTPDAQLRLITCSGAFDDARRSYVDNTVVYAVAT